MEFPAERECVLAGLAGCGAGGGAGGRVGVYASRISARLTPRECTAGLSAGCEGQLKDTEFECWIMGVDAG